MIHYALKLTKLSFLVYIDSGEDRQRWHIKKLEQLLRAASRLKDARNQPSAAIFD